MRVGPGRRVSSGGAMLWSWVENNNKATEKVEKQTISHSCVRVSFLAGPIITLFFSQLITRWNAGLPCICVRHMNAITYLTLLHTETLPAAISVPVPLPPSASLPPSAPFWFFIPTLKEIKIAAQSRWSCYLDLTQRTASIIIDDRYLNTNQLCWFCEMSRQVRDTRTICSVWKYL